MSAKTWKDQLAGQITPALNDEIDAFEAQIHLRKAGKLDELARRVDADIEASRFKPL